MKTSALLLAAVTLISGSAFAADPILVHCVVGTGCTNTPVASAPVKFNRADADKSLENALSTKLADQGVISLKGKISWKKTSTPGVYEASGKVDENALWGGDSVQPFTVDMNIGTGEISGLHVGSDVSDDGSNVSRDSSTTSAASSSAAPAAAATGAGIKRN